jgi:hypothetical protein
MPPSRKHHNRIRELVLQSAGRLFNHHGFNAVSIDTFPMIGLPNDISRTDRAVSQAFESVLKLMIQSFEQAAQPLLRTS